MMNKTICKLLGKVKAMYRYTTTKPVDPSEMVLFYGWLCLCLAVVLTHILPQTNNMAICILTCLALEIVMISKYAINSKPKRISD